MTVIRWYRSWPRHDVPDHDCHYESGESVPCTVCHPAAKYGRHPDPPVPARIVDNLPRILIENYDYCTADLPEDRPGFCLLEWDVALDSTERFRFASIAAETPDHVLVAPYSIYDIAGEPSCVHRDVHGEPIPYAYPVCDTFGLGCIYIPARILSRFLGDVGHLGMTDATFSRYVFDHYGPTRVNWAFHPQHLSGD